MVSGESFDLLLATEVMHGHLRPYSTDLNAAWFLWQEMAGRFELFLSGNGHHTEIAQVFQTKPPEVIARSNSPSHAICLAAKRLLLS